MRVRQFQVRVDVSEQFLAQEPELARSLVWEQIIERAAEPLTGPRGGRYEAVTPPYRYDEGQDIDGFARGQRTFVGVLDARYVRPRHRPATPTPTTEEPNSITGTPEDYR